MLDAFTFTDQLRTNRKKIDHAAALISRLIARRTHSFRVQPCFMYVRKMNIALCRLKELNIHESCVEMQRAIGVAKTARKIDDSYYLPVKENFEHLLMEFQSYTKLLTRISMCAREAHRMFLDMINRSAFLESLSLFMAVTAHIWSICTDLCKSAVHLYNVYFRFYEAIYGSTAEYPGLLDEWLGGDYKAYVDIEMDKNASKSSKDLFLFDDNAEAVEAKPIEQKFEPKLLVQRTAGGKKRNRHEQDDEPKPKIKIFKTENLLEERTFKPNAPEPMEESPIQSQHINKKVSMKSFDLGEKIERKNLSAPKIETPIKHINVDELKSIKEIRDFLEIESDLRGKKQAKNTDGVTDYDWKHFTKSTNQILILGHHGLVVRKFKQSWQQLMRKAKK